MSRKDESKAKDAIVTVNIDDFTRTRDSVIVSLATLQSAVSDLSRAYINHANTVLNRGPVSMESSLSTGLAGGLATSLLENGLLGGAVAHHAPAQETQPKDKKRKRAHDPNAPKRALTPYFLFMQHNRQQIADEMGPDVKPSEVSSEGTRRWSTMSDSDKAVWKKLYLQNLAVYKQKVEAYKAGLPIPEDDDHAQADSQLQQSIAEAEAEDSDETSESEDSEDEADKEPTPPPSNKRRRNAGTSKAAAAPAPASPVVAKKSSPEKKTKTPVAKKDITPASKPLDSTDSKRKTKKRKSEGAPQE